ncbi:MAG: DEAD/DEAH box helicase family protein [Balneolales bacterium]|nr:DEAD/DEAH box helicase family protein [Balneolales bacterium]
MRYNGKACELVGEKEVFGERIAWIRLMEDQSFHEVPYDALEQSASVFSRHEIRFIAVAAKIKDEVARKNILAPYESSLIPLPHQILVLEKVMQSAQNRFLLADEVGMGKTIETGLILKELKIRGDIKRTLAIVPKSSMLQWQSELKDHFNEVFHVYDSEMITSMARTFANINADEEYNFWTQHNQIIVSTDALKPLEGRQGWSRDRVHEYNKYRLESVLRADFDLVIIDEAHKMGGANPTVSRYLLAQELCNTVPNVLLLTATPHRGKADHFRRILQLLDPDAFDGEGLPAIEELEPYVIRTEKRHAVDYEGNKLFSKRRTHRFDVQLDPQKHAAQLALYEAVTDYVREGFNAAKQTGNAAKGLMMVLFQRLASSSTAAIHSAMLRRLNRLRNGEIGGEEDFGEDAGSLADDTAAELGFNEKTGFADGEMPHEDDVLELLVQQAETCMRTEADAKADALLQKIIELRQLHYQEDLKILVFTEFRTTQKMLVTFFDERGYEVVFIHGGQEIDERRRSLGRFKEQAQILIATDAAGESLNMQFCHILFNYDLPWNPMMIEQRIGRIDRIGQKHVIDAWNMITSNSVDLRVYEVIEEKLTTILEQLGIDKTSDVLDSTFEMKDVNKLYLQSLLDPDRFDLTEAGFLHDIKNKLSEYKSTEGALPHVAEDEIEYKKAADVKHSPLPHWLETLIQEYVAIHGGSYTRNLMGHADVRVHGEHRRITFDAEAALDHPVTEHISLQHDWIRKLLNDLSTFNTAGGIPALRSEKGGETPGVWSLWQISARNQLESKEAWHCFFIADSGSEYTAYANDIWSRLIQEPETFRQEANYNLSEPELYQQKLDKALRSCYQNIQAALSVSMQTKKENRISSFEFQRSRILKIGIANIRNAKLRKLEAEHDAWISEFSRNRKLIPNLRQLLAIRING